MVVQRDGMGMVPTDEPGHRAVAARYTMHGADGLRIQLCSYGARVVSVMQSDSEGVLDDVVLGFDDAGGYVDHRDFYWGAVLGRVAGRLINSQCMCLDQLLKLFPNLGGDHFNGGTRGFDNVVWDSSIEGEDEVVFSLLSEDMDEGYPCHVLAQATYTLVDGCELRLRLTASCTAPTPLALAHNIPFNLAGHASGKRGLMEQNLAINATKYFVVDFDGYPTGDVFPVEGTTLDFRTRRLLGKVHKLVPRGGLNHIMAYTEAVEHGPHFVARLHHELSGRCVEVRSDLPCVYVDTMRWLPAAQVPYEDNFMPDLGKRQRKWPEWMPRPKPVPELVVYRGEILDPDAPPDRWFMKFPCKTVKDAPQLGDMVPFAAERDLVVGRAGAPYWRHGGIIIQPQPFPDTMDHQYLPTYSLKPGEIYTQNVWYRFFCMHSDQSDHRKARSRETDLEEIEDETNTEETNTEM